MKMSKDQLLGAAKKGLVKKPQSSADSVAATDRMSSTMAAIKSRGLDIADLENRTGKKATPEMMRSALRAGWKKPAEGTAAAQRASVMAKKAAAKKPADEGIAKQAKMGKAKAMAAVNRARSSGTRRSRG